MCMMFMAHGANLELKNGSGETPFDCVPDENSDCAKAIEFNQRLRRMADLDERTIVSQ